MHNFDLSRLVQSETEFVAGQQVPTGLGKPLSPALLYDAVYEARRADVAIYVGVALACPGPVLELGAGTGRLLVPLLSRGIDAWGLENDPVMLKAGCERLTSVGTRENCRRLLEGDMRAFTLGRQFSLVVLACNTLSLMLEDEQLLNVLRCVREHLESEGGLLFDVSVAEGHSWYKEPFSWQAPPQTVWVGGVAALATESGRFEPESRLCTVRRQFALADGRRAKTTTITRQRSMEEIVRLLTFSGLRVEGDLLDERGVSLSEASCVAYVRAGKA